MSHFSKKFVNPVRYKTMPGIFGEVDLSKRNKVIFINPQKNRSGTEYLDTLVHENLHIAHPGWSEEKVQVEAEKHRLSTLTII